MNSEVSWPSGEMRADASTVIDTITPREDRRSSLYLTRFEVAKIVGERAKQIASNALLSASSGAAAMASPERSQSAIGTPIQRWRRLPEQSSIFQLAEKSVNPTSRAVDPVMIAKIELSEKRIAMVIKRSFPDGRCENIPVQELEVDPTLLDLRL